MLYSEVYEEINKKLNILRDLDRGYAVFGSDGHKYKLNPKLTEDEVSKFEALNNIKLPDGYRGFLIHVGNGGAGMGYEIYGIDIDKKDENLSNEFILEDNYYWECDFSEEEKGEIYDNGCKNCKYNDKCLSSMFVNGKELEEEKYLGGTMRISYEGCTYYRRLILNGKFKGEMWSESDGQGLLRSDMDFIKSYENWLDWNIDLILKIRDLVKQGLPYDEIDSNEEVKYFTMKWKVIAGYMKEEIESISKQDIDDMIGVNIIKVYEYLREKTLQQDFIKLKADYKKRVNEEIADYNRRVRIMLLFIGGILAIFIIFYFVVMIMARFES